MEYLGLIIVIGILLGTIGFIAWAATQGRKPKSKKQPTALYFMDKDGKIKPVEKPEENHAKGLPFQGMPRTDMPRGHNPKRRYR
jgi:hypothetical protein